MAWPPAVLPINKTDATDQEADHSANHNNANKAINDTVAHLGQFKIVARRGPVTTDSGGNGNVSFTTAFPAAPAVVASIADPATSGMINVYAVSAGGFSVHVNSTNGAAFSGSVTIAYIATYGDVW